MMKTPSSLMQAGGFVPYNATSSAGLPSARENSIRDYCLFGLKPAPEPAPEPVPELALTPKGVRNPLLTPALTWRLIILILVENGNPACTVILCQSARRGMIFTAL